MESDDGPETVLVTSGDHMEHRFNGIRRDANLIALGATWSVAEGRDGRGVIDSYRSSFRSVSDGGNGLEQHPERNFNGTRRLAELTATGAAWSLARNAAENDGDSQAVSEAAGQGDARVDHHVEQRFNGGGRGAFPVAVAATRSVGRGEEHEEAAWTTADEGRRREGSRTSSDASSAVMESRQSRSVTVTEDRSATTVISTPKHSSSTLSGTQSASAAWSSAGAATSVSKSTAATASMDNVWSGNGDDMVVIYERQDSEVTFSPQARQRRLHNAQSDKMERQGNGTVTLSNDSAERRWEEFMQRQGKRRRHGSSSTTPSDSSGDSEHDVQRLTSPRARKERQVSVVSPKQANGVIAANKKSERNRTSESERRQAVRSPEQSVTATSKQKRSVEWTGNGLAAAVVDSNDSEVHETEERRRRDTEKSSRMKDGGAKYVI